MNRDGEERLQLENGKYVRINFASSGQQEVVWILNVLFYYLLNNKKIYFIIEEPESHLFPNAQKLIAEFIALVQKGGKVRYSLLLTAPIYWELLIIYYMLIGYLSMLIKKIK